MNQPSLFDWRQTYSDFFQWLESRGQHAWLADLQQRLGERFEERPHGDLPRWMEALAKLPAVENARLIADRALVTVTTPAIPPASRRQAREALAGLHPWRKGPFDILGNFIDTEWRSDWKWARIAPHLAPLEGRRILDVGCGSGYHCWRLLGAGASRVLGVDPSLLFLMQFLAVKRYAPAAPVDMLPLRGEDLPANLGLFDTVLSMGILYHRRSPLDHLLELHGTLRDGGELVLETLVVEGEEGMTLMPEGRYGRMRNVWFIPSAPTLERWLQRTGFRQIRAVDLTPTGPAEQRSTQWMRFQSLPDFLDPANPDRTIEGYPGPLRATLVAEKC